MYKSMDGGKTWQNVGLQKTLYINSVLVDPRNAGVVLVGALGSGEFGGVGRFGSIHIPVGTWVT